VAGRGCDWSRSSEARRRFTVRWVSALSLSIHSALSLAHRRDSRRSSWALFGRGSSWLGPFSAISKAAADLGIVWIPASPVPAPFAGGDEVTMLGEERLLVTLLCIGFRERYFGGALATAGWSLGTCLESLNHFQSFCDARQISAENLSDVLGNAVGRDFVVQLCQVKLGCAAAGRNE
jgi:hypothetical protein